MGQVPGQHTCAGDPNHEHTSVPESCLWGDRASTPSTLPGPFSSQSLMSSGLEMKVIWMSFTCPDSIESHVLRIQLPFWLTL